MTVGTSTVSVTQSAAACAESPGLTPTGVAFDADGSGSGGVTVSGSGHCGYDVTVPAAAASWLSADVSRVSGGGTVTFQATENAGAERTVTVMVGTSTVSVTQSAATCPESPVVTPSAVTLGADGTGSGSVTVNGSGHCGYDVSVSSGASSWLRVDAARVSGGGTVTLRATENTGAGRTGAVAVGSARVSVTQSAAPCPLSPGVTPVAVKLRADGSDSAGVTVSAPVHCSYRVSAAVGGHLWVRVGMRSVSGGGTLRVWAAPNSGGERTTTVYVGTVLVNVTQSALCSDPPVLTPDAVALEADGSGAGGVTVAGPEPCAYPVAVSSDASSWLSADATLVSAGGTVMLRAAVNAGGERTGAVMVGTAAAPVTQWGATCPPAPVVTPSTVSHASGGGSTPVSVRGSARCAYAARADATWVTVDPAQVTGGGTVTVTVAVDADGAGVRRGTVTIGETAVRVAQGNTAPVAADDTATAWRETETAVAVLDNDTDADGDPLVVSSVATAPANGTAAVSADGQSVTYTPAAGWWGVETFTYAVTDGFGGTAEATVTVTVRSATPFTDPVLTVGVTPIKAVHMTELRTRANGVRAGCGLSAATWTDAVLTAKVTPIKAVHWTELRDALAAAHTACGRTAPVWTDPVLTAGVTPIRAAHMLELREAVIALE